MTSRLNPYISFDGNARQAMEFYKEVFGGTLTLSTYGEFGEEQAGEAADKIMHSMLETAGGFTLMCGDIPPGMEHKPGNNIAVSVSGDDDGELRGYWDKLSGDGTISVPLEKQMWGDVFGMCTDRFGITWLIDISEREG
ncbi:VOC family protein [Streptomyces vilmorinianum]|uniref:VOC family protein n=1 Tax=Streptomyces vilmorinianum TaxID=3051092 RepID=UPI0010FB16B5|nr:VOC family protein [Streptomyces vilmorinianum]